MSAVLPALSPHPLRRIPLWSLLFPTCLYLPSLFPLLQASVGPANDWELFSRWAGEPWGATLSPSVIYTHLEPSLVDWLIQQV
jgi:hypothetical protein